MAGTLPAGAPGPEGERLDILAAAPLPYRLGGREHFQLGGCLYCATLLSGLSRLGHRVRALASAPRPKELGQPESNGSGVQVEWFALDFRSAATPPPEPYVRRERARYEAALDRALAERRPDLVVLGSESQAWYCVEACRERGLPTVLIAHGVPSAALATGIYPPWAVDALLGHLRRVDLVVAVARHLEDALRSYGVTSVRAVPTGFDTAMFAPAGRDPALLELVGIGPDRVVVGSFSHLRPEKRVLDLVASIEPASRSDPRLLYLIVGDGPGLQEAVDRATASGLGDRVRFVGELEHDRVPAYMSLCDVVVLASEREGSSLVCREAQASGRALLVSDIPAGRETIGDPPAGLLFRLGDPGDLAAKTVELARDAALRARLATNGWKAAQAYTEEHWVRAVSAALVETARSRRAG
mgnify:CR=1 FL=1